MNTINGWKYYLEAERRYSPLTVDAYIDDLAVFIKYTECEEFNPAAVSFTDVRSYVMSLVERGDSPRSTNRHIAALKSFFKYLQRNNVIIVNPTSKIKSLKLPSTLPEFISERQSQQLFEHLLESAAKHEGTESRNALIVLLLYTTGMRRAELASLTCDRIDIPQRKIRVMGKGSKEREIPLLDNICELLEHYLQENSCKTEEKYLFLTEQSRPINTNDIYIIVSSTLRAAGILGRVNPHTLRHSFATHMMSHGAELTSIQKLLGHSSIASTQIYTHNTIETLKASYQNAHPRAKKQ